MPEQMPGPEIRIVGGASEEKKEELHEELRGYFGEHHLEGMTDEQQETLFEREEPKTERQRAALAFADKKTSELMKRAGIEPYGIPERNTHIIPFDAYQKLQRKDSAVATTIQNQQGIVVVREEIERNDTLFADIAFHEQMHLKSHYAVELEERPSTADKPTTQRKGYRSGITVMSAQQSEERNQWHHEHFRGVNEAVIALHEREFMRDTMRSLPEFRSDYLWMGSTEGEVKRLRIAQKAGLSPEDVFWVDKDSESERYNVVSYPRQRQTLVSVIQEIQKELPETYPDTDDVLEEFTKAFFTGRLMQLGKIVEQTFGKGSFRILGMMKDDRESPVEVLETLRKMRAGRRAARQEQQEGQGGL